MQQQKLIILLNRVLKGESRKLSKENQYVWWSPFVNHHKPKLEINFTENANGSNPWHCWVCHKRGKYIAGLFKSMGAAEDKIIESISILLLGVLSSGVDRALERFLDLC